MTPSISVILPAFNEQALLATAVQQIARTFDACLVDYEIIIVDDASRDDTPAIADQLAKRFSRVSVIHHEKNQGAGGAFRTGLARAQKDYVVFIPADNPLLPEDLHPYLEHLGQSDIVAGVREERAGYPLFFRFASFVYNRILIPALFQAQFRDFNWIQIYRREIFNLLQIENDGIFFFAEILIKAHQNGLKVIAVPARMRPRAQGKPTCFRTRVILKTFRDAMRFFWKNKILRVKGPS